MSGTICEFDENLIKEIEKLRFNRSKNISAIICKINKDKLLIEIEEKLPNTSFEEISDLLENTPRYLILSYELLLNNRVLYPFVFIYYHPASNIELNMLYASNKYQLQEAAKITKQIELVNADDFSKEWLNKHF